MGAVAACQQWTGAEPVSPGDGDDELVGVAVLGACNVWAVGFYEEGSNRLTLIERWNGFAWKQVTSPSPGSLDELRDIAPPWAVGSTFDAGVTRTLVLRRIGSTWAQLTSPSPSASFNTLQAVVSLSKSNAWAVGSEQGASASRTLILRWNGNSWKRVPSPNVGGASTPNQLLGISAVSARDIWAVGFDGEGGQDHTLTLHWTGNRWRVVPSPNAGDSNFGDFLTAVAARSADDAWAVGHYSEGSVLKAQILHWNGKRWKRVRLPNLGSGPSVLEGVHVISRNNAWAVGGTFLGNLVLHWNGRSWKKVPVANPGTLENFLEDVDALSPREIWAVGESRDTGPTPYQARAMHCC